MAVNIQFDKVQWIEIGYDATHMIQIDNVVSFADRVVSPDGDMVYPMEFINLFTPPGVHHNHKYWELEMVLDTDYLPDDTAPTQYWAEYLDVQDAVGVQPAIVCDDEFNSIEWFKVYIREGDGTQTCLTYSDEDDDVLWCIGENSEFDNETGTTHQTKTFRFICLQERSKSYTAEVHNPGNAGYANEAPVKTMRVDNFTRGNAATNVLRYSDEFVTQMTPQFMPNTFQGLDMKQDQHWRILTLVLDSESDILDAYIDITTANTVIPANFYVETTLADGLATTERWTYAGTVNYIISRREGTVHADVPRDTIEYRIITECCRTISHP